MDFAYYAQEAARLVNADLSDLDSLRGALSDREWYASRLTPRDLAKLRTMQSLLREVFETAAAGDEPGTVQLLNNLLGRFRIAPRISGHDAQSWHLHVTANGAAVGDDLAAEAIMGLAITLIDYGADRLGTCAADWCDNVYLDTSPNRSRRYCSDRCASRANVAAFRARQKAAASRRRRRR